jgi:hypothetical protein
MEWFEKSQDIKMILKSSLSFQIESLSHYRTILFKYLNYYFLKHFLDIKDSLEDLIKDLASVVSLEFGMQKRNEDSKKIQKIEEFKSFCKDFDLKYSNLYQDYISFKVKEFVYTIDQQD